MDTGASKGQVLSVSIDDSHPPRQQIRLKLHPHRDAGHSIWFDLLIQFQALKLEELGVTGSDAENVCYLRDLADATRLVDVMQTSTGGNVVVNDGGYVGTECAASLVIYKINVSMVFP